MHAVERNESALTGIITSLSDATGPVTGATLARSVYDPTADEWLQWGDSSWGALADPTACTEVVVGDYDGPPIDLSQADPASDFLIVRTEVTAGPAEFVGQVDREVLFFRSSVKDVPGDVWRSIIATINAPGNAAEALLAAGGGLTPDAIAQEVVDQILSALPADYENDTGSVGQILFNIDSDTLKALLSAALGKIIRFGYMYLGWPTQEVFVDEIGKVLARPIIQNGELVDLTGATIAWRFINKIDATEETRVGTIGATPGYAEYETVAGDVGGTLLGAAGDWYAYATATLPGGETPTSERMLLKVKAVV